MPSYLKPFVAFGLLFVCAATAHDVEEHHGVVIDTDMGLDDAVAVAMALQEPRADIVAVVACEGAAGRKNGVEHLERLLHLFNRKEIPLYAPVMTQQRRPSPPFRQFAEEAIGDALPKTVTPFHRSFLPEAYVTKGRKTVILVLGPLTNVAAALKAKPDIKQGIEKIIVAGSPDASKGWNIRFDRQALAVVQASGIPLQFVVPGPASRKPESWRQGEMTIGQQTSICEGFLRELLNDPEVRRHYNEQFDSFHDELVLLYFLDDSLFAPSGYTNAFAAVNRDGVFKLFTRLISYGRQRKSRVVFVDGPLPDTIFQEDVRQRKAGIIAKNGEDEWFAGVLMNEFHEHLGAYSLIGVKMGLRAGELLNAPQHAMKVTSGVAAEPPVSCLSDGLLVSTGSTPGRGLFSHVPGPPGSVKTTFAYNGRSITLTLKKEYKDKIKRRIEVLRGEYTLADHEYWDGVRSFGLDIWETWHRRDLFDIVDTTGASAE